MAFQQYIKIDGKKYKVMADLYTPVRQRQRVVSLGLTGKTIIQDFTVADRIPNLWEFRLKVFIVQQTDTTWGTYANLLTAVDQDTVPFIEHDDTKTHDVTLDGLIVQEPRVPANIEGHFGGIVYVNVRLTKVYE